MTGVLMRRGRFGHRDTDRGKVTPCAKTEAVRSDVATAWERRGLLVAVSSGCSDKCHGLKLLNRHLFLHYLSFPSLSTLTWDRFPLAHTESTLVYLLLLKGHALPCPRAFARATSSACKALLARHMVGSFLSFRCCLPCQLFLSEVAPHCGRLSNAPSEDVCIPFPGPLNVLCCTQGGLKVADGMNLLIVKITALSWIIGRTWG